MIGDLTRPRTVALTPARLVASNSRLFFKATAVAALELEVLFSFMFGDASEREAPAFLSWTTGRLSHRKAQSRRVAFCKWEREGISHDQACDSGRVPTRHRGKSAKVIFFFFCPANKC